MSKHAAKQDCDFFKQNKIGRIEGGGTGNGSASDETDGSDEEADEEAQQQAGTGKEKGKGGWARMRSATLFGSSGINRDGVVTFPFHVAFKIGTGSRGEAAPSIKFSVNTEQERGAWVRAINHNVKLLIVK